MSFIAEFEIDSPILREVSVANPDVEILMEDIVLQPQERTKFVFLAIGADRQSFESGLAADETVGEFVRIEELSHGSVYRVTFSDHVDPSVTYRAATGVDATFLTLRLQDGTATIRARMPDRAALESYRQFCDEQDIPFRLRRLYRRTDADPREYDLSDAQWEALSVAHEMGYFEQPRAAPLADVATALDVTPQAVSGLLRRGLDSLVGTTIADRDGTDTDE